jgi:2-alkyl-3-oxoalkanoate reductase
MMKIFVAGGTGSIGSHIIKCALKSGYEVYGMTHSTERAKMITEMGAQPVIADALNADEIANVINSIKPEVVINMLSSLPKVYTPQTMREAADQVEKLRQIGGANLQAAAIAAGTRRFIIQSAAYWYASGSSLASEGTPFAFNATPAIAHGTFLLEKLEMRLLNEKSLEGVVMRYGFFYGPGTWFEKDGDLARQINKQIYPIVKDGRGMWNFVHIEDAAIGTILACNGPPGIYNINDDYPSEMRQWAPAYAHWIGAPNPKTITSEEYLLKNGPDAHYYATSLRAASNMKAKQLLKFKPRPLEWIVKK